MQRDILVLGNPMLYQKSTPVLPEELHTLPALVQDMHDTLFAYRNKYGAGRAIAAVQIGVLKRVIYLHIKKPVVLVNPTLTFVGDETMDVMDDCMSFPGLLVKVRRHRRCRVSYTGETGAPHTLNAEGDLAELLQHEYDHLDGILAVMRAKDGRALHMRQN